MPTIENWRALREALEAGPTEGERFTQGALPWYTDKDKFVQFQTFDISTGSQDRQHDDYYLICSVSNISNDPCNKANAKLIAAADPTTIRALLDERDRLEKALALVQSHHATAWNRGHTIGLAAANDFKLQAEKYRTSDAWDNTRLTEALLAAEAERDRLAAEVEALRADAERYRMVRRGQHWSVIDGIGDEWRADELDAAIDAARGIKEGGAA